MPIANSVSVTAGSPTIVGYLTAFVAAEDDTLYLDGFSVPIFAKISNTELTLRFAWPGATAADQVDWRILPTGPYWSSTVVVNRRITELIDRINAGMPLKPGAAGPIAARDDHDDQDEGFIYLSTDEAPPLLYVRLGAAPGGWTPGLSIQGPPGTPAEYRVNPVTYEIEYRAAGSNDPWIAMPNGDLDLIVGPYRADAQASAATAAADAAATAADRIAVAGDRTAVTGLTADTQAIHDATDLLRIAGAASATIAGTKRDEAVVAAADATYYAGLLNSLVYDMGTLADTVAAGQFDMGTL